MCSGLNWFRYQARAPDSWTASELEQWELGGRCLEVFEGNIWFVKDSALVQMDGKTGRQQEIKRQQGAIYALFAAGGSLWVGSNNAVGKFASGKHSWLNTDFPVRDLLYLPDEQQLIVASDGYVLRFNAPDFSKPTLTASMGENS
ncbi:MAG: hypothetical protein IPK76_03030 [Lewinellaceae bacterium]|nr:hypothetical protein [Lewinellaceae bacterium]